ncbi:ornithine carbamoyltransferase [Chania multitudinisentens RB-25]|uniref:Ornithine carbamoyltransferase n=1 Tax=Chania multitudinisentens RB-25 TaxID=1441930 RepID=W0LBC3_9GAMM|nr:ornithine carbamoyltransferase [Chania multitudinisentens RB-25]
MYSTKTFTLKKLVLALAIAGYAMNSAYAVLTNPTGTIQGRAPVLSAPSNNAPQTVDLSSNAAGDNLSTGDTITLSYAYADLDGDADNSTSQVHWYYVKEGVETEITGSILNTPATESTPGTSVLTIPAIALGAEAIKVVIQEYSASGAPRAGQTITVNDTSEGGGGTVTPPGPIMPGGNVTPGIYLSTDTAFANNLIGSATNLNVGDTYVFRLWDSAAAGATDLTSSVSYNWRLVGTSATTNTTAPAEGFDTQTTDGNFTIPANTDGTLLTGSADGVQGFSLAVDYN